MAVAMRHDQRGGGARGRPEGGREDGRGGHRHASRAPRKAGEPRGSRHERTVLGVPARFMAPRILFALAALALLGFGLVMVYSASSIQALNATDGADAAFYFKRQLSFAVIGVICVGALCRIDYHALCRDNLLIAFFLVSVCLLLAVRLFGTSQYGATRSFNLGPISVQASELAKVTILLAAANILDTYFRKRTMDLKSLVGATALFVLFPLILILVQPDKGTTGIIIVMLFALMYIAGMPRPVMLALFGIGVIGAVILVLRDGYALERVKTVFDPVSVADDEGYQIVQGFLALGSGGPFGLGLGMSRQKYSYLPMAHTDFIFAIVGEELGFVGLAAMLACFVVLVYAGLKIASEAPDLLGRMVATGGVTIIGVQALLNICGVIGIFPLSGKPLPFFTYGGSSLISTLLTVGCVLSVSFHSALPETVHDRRRSGLRVAGEGAPGFEVPASGGAGVPPLSPRPMAAGADRLGVGTPVPRAPRMPASVGQSARPAYPATAERPQDGPGAPDRKPALTVLDGGRGSGEPEVARRRTQGGYGERIELGRDDAARLRPERGPQLRGRSEGSVRLDRKGRDRDV